MEYVVNMTIYQSLSSRRRLMKPLQIRMLTLIIAMSMLMPSPVSAEKSKTSSFSANPLTTVAVQAEKLVNLASGYCLDTDGKAANNGQVRMWECANHSNQTWTVEPVGSSYYHLVNQNSKYCLDTDGVKKNGGLVRMWGCANHPNQLWEIQDLPTDHYRLKNKASGLCLDTEGFSKNGEKVRMWECSDNSVQTWIIPKETIVGITKLANLASGYCLDTDGSNSQRSGGGQVRMWDCIIHTNQTWTVEQVDPTYFRLNNEGSKFCLEADGSKKNGSPVVMSACSNRSNQLWEIQNLPKARYRLKNKASGFCLDTDGKKVNNGQVRMWECVDHPNQTWLQNFRPAKLIELQVVVIKVADDNGSHNSADTFSDATINAMIDDTNAIYMPDTGIKVVLQKITSLNNTKINRLTDWSWSGCPDAEQTIANPNPNFPNWFLSPSQYEAYLYATKNYPKQIVIYIHKQAYDKTCQVITDHGAGFSHPDLNFIAISSWGNTGTIGMVFDGQKWQVANSYLAHELGHFLGITHTMVNEWPLNQSEATAQLNTFCKDNPTSITSNLPDIVWNLDQLSDTPGDPGYLLYNRVYFNIGDGQETPSVNQCLGRGSYQVISDVCKQKGGLATSAFMVKPARENVMSYTNQCPYLKGNTTGETRARITPQQVDVILHALYTNRKNLLSTVPYLQMPYVIPPYLLEPTLIYENKRLNP